MDRALPAPFFGLLPAFDPSGCAGLPTQDPAGALPPKPLYVQCMRKVVAHAHVSPQGKISCQDALQVVTEKLMAQ